MERQSSIKENLYSKSYLFNDCIKCVLIFKYIVKLMKLLLLDKDIYYFHGKHILFIDAFIERLRACRNFIYNIVYLSYFFPSF